MKNKLPLTDEQNYHRWTIAVKMMKELGHQEMTMGEFQKLLDLVDPDYIRQMFPVLGLKTLSAGITQVEATKISNMKRNFPELKKLSRQEVREHPLYNQCNTRGKFINTLYEEQDDGDTEE